MPPPVLDYSNCHPPRRWVAKAVAGAMFVLGLLSVGRGLRTVCWPSEHTAYDLKVILHNAWADVLFGMVLLVPAICVVLGWVRDEPSSKVPPC